jgi:soluble lytic murein transglycosylase-like protein
VDAKPLRRLIASVFTLALLLDHASALAKSAPARLPGPQVTPEQTADCIERSADWANVHPALLRAIARVESQDNPSAVNWNRNGSYDVGLMQINSFWYNRGLGPWWQGLGHPCVSAAAGAWVLKQCVEDHGYNWAAVGCYNAGANWKRTNPSAGTRYIRRVQRAVQDLNALPQLHRRALDQDAIRPNDR